MIHAKVAKNIVFKNVYGYGDIFIITIKFKSLQHNMYHLRQECNYNMKTQNQKFKKRLCLGDRISDLVFF